MKTPALLIISLLAAHLACAQAILLAVRGQPANYTIIRAADASPSQIYAAEEFQRFTAEMTGVMLPIATDEGPLPAQAVLLGATRHTAAALGTQVDIQGLGPDGFRIVVKPPHLLIIGGPQRGTLYGVYESLERFGGCRWYSSWHSFIPQRDSFEMLLLDETQRPAFALREPFWFDMFDGDFAARNKSNGNAMRLSEKHGGKIRFGNGFFVHTFNTLCSPDKYFDTHPEYFSEIKGQRVKEHTQLCLTNPDVLKIAIESLLAGIRKDPTAKLFSVSQNDWYNFCTCPACKAIDDREESHAGTMIEFVNRVAAAVEQEYPDIWIETLAYQYTRKPPKTVRPRHNVVPRLCTIECDFSQSLDQSPFRENLKFVEEIQGWSAITDKLYIWDYTTNFRNYTSPFPNVRALQGNVRFFRDNHVVGLFEQGAYQGRHGDFAELKAWLLARWLWNPELAFEDLLTDFLNGYYGKAAPVVRSYFNEVHTFYPNPAQQPLRIFDNISSSALSDEFLEQAVALWQKAEDAVKDSPAHSYNVRMSAIPVLHAWLTRNAKHDAIVVWAARNVERFVPPAAQQTIASALVSRFEEAKDIRLSEGMPTHDKILAGWRVLSNPQPLPPPSDHAIIEDTVLSLGNRGKWGDTVADPLAEDGSAMKLYNTHYEWCTTLPFRGVAFDEGQKYRIRMRVRVEKTPGQEGEAFWAGIYDGANKRSCGGIEAKTSEVGEGYQWYDVAEWVPETAHYFWIGPGRFDLQGGAKSNIQALYIDKLELLRVE
ncbi:MAG: DUF4838 domain-containing protein [Kiritimatiellae bacterium]|nr:DUF4838 domain-containing protein [Kiritimatiellia bacterium]